MEQKKVQRIIGVVVVIALVIVVIPLLFGKNDFPVQESANIKAPPFPDQQQSTVTTAANDTQTSTSANVNKEANATSPQDNATPVNANEGTANPSSDSASIKLPEPPALSNSTETTTVEMKPVDASQTDTTQATDKDKPTVDVTPAMADKVNNDSATVPAANNTDPSLSQPVPGSIVYEPVTAPTADNNKTPSEADTKKPVPVTATETLPRLKENETAVTKPQMVKEDNTPLPKPVKNSHAKNVPVKTHKTVPVAKAVASGWVVQMGNFSVKKNAIHLANVLQAAGYKAFTQDVKSKSGVVHTRVYIGPELKEASATQLSKEIHEKLSMQGFVVSYKSTKV